MNRIVSYLPISHLAGLQWDVLNALVYDPGTHCEIYFARPDAMQGTLVESLKWGRPTSFFAVPRVWEKLELALKAQMTKQSSFSQGLNSWA